MLLVTRHDNIIDSANGRYLNGYTSMVDNYGFEISSPNTTEVISTPSSEGVQAKPCSMQPQEGKSPGIARSKYSLIGIGEIFLLPLDVLKIKRQTNPEAFRGRGLFKIIRDEGFALYRGWEWTAARNAPGSFAVHPLCSIAYYSYLEEVHLQRNIYSD